MLYIIYTCKNHLYYPSQIVLKPIMSGNLKNFMCTQRITSWHIAVKKDARKASPPPPPSPPIETPRTIFLLCRGPLGSIYHAGFKIESCV